VSQSRKVEAITSPTEAAAQAVDESTGVATQLLERLADRLGGRASVTAVFGEPVVAEDVTIIPVASVAFGFGGGTGREVNADKTGEGGGGGGGAHARPLGYIEIKEGAATYRPIRDLWTDLALPLAVLVAGATAPKIARALIRLRRRRA
jgi:uncharacterized spore protein YtfJ